MSFKHISISIVLNLYVIVPLIYIHTYPFLMTLHGHNSKQHILWNIRRYLCTAVVTEVTVGNQHFPRSIDILMKTYASIQKHTCTHTTYTPHTCTHVHTQPWLSNLCSLYFIPQIVSFAINWVVVICKWLSALYDYDDNAFSYRSYKIFSPWLLSTMNAPTPDTWHIRPSDIIASARAFWDNPLTIIAGSFLSLSFKVVAFAWSRSSLFTDPLFMSSVISEEGLAKLLFFYLIDNIVWLI